MVNYYLRDEELLKPLVTVRKPLDFVQQYT